MTDLPSFGQRLRELRDAAGLTQKGLAEKAGVALRTVSSLEQGLYDATFPTVLALAAALGVDCTAFTQPPAEREPAGPGRPRKPEAEPAPVVEEKPKVKAKGKPKGKRGKGNG